ncbi:MAG TPA: S1 RNA-binding domain-containing protein [Granulicella sp.]|jgi:small subunit ribosomal protein S1|nr:S1 RNA-binding domain-containing protein [Granulicella sp.]
MSIPEDKLPASTPEPAAPFDAAEAADSTESTESFDQILSQFERTHSHKTGTDDRQISGTVVAVTADSVLVDIGYKTEGILPLTVFTTSGQPIAVGDKLTVTSKGRNPEGYYDLSLQKVAQPKDISALEAAFAAQTVIAGTVTAIVKGGLTVDVGVRAFLPGSRSGARDAADLAALIGQEIRCRILKLEKESEDSVDIVVDRRAVLEEEEKSTKDRRFAELQEGDIVTGTVRSLTDYGAFLDLGGVDGLLHISDIAWTRLAKPSDLLTVGEQLQVKVLKIDQTSHLDKAGHATRRIALGLKQTQPHPWDAVPTTYTVGERIRGAVTRLTDFGAFVELAPGIEGMIHVSEMSWAKKVRKPEDLLKLGDVVDAVILGINLAEKRIALGLKQTLGDPWSEAPRKFPVGSTISGPISSLTKFGAFLTLAEGVEGLIHVSEISAEKRIERPQDVLRTGQTVQAKVLEIDPVKRQIRLSMKQLVPTGLDDFLAEHKPGDPVTGRITKLDGTHATIELGDGVLALCTLPAPETTDTAEPEPAKATAGALDLSAFSSMLNAKWKTGTSTAKPKPEAPQPGQIRNFRIATLNPETKTITVTLAS